MTKHTALDITNDPGTDEEYRVLWIELPSATTCTCGCGMTVNKGRKFRQGHDAKLKGALIEAHLAGVEVTIDYGGSAVTTDALSAAAAYGWGHFLDNAYARRVTIESKRAERASIRAAKAATKPAKASKQEPLITRTIKIAGGREVQAVLLSSVYGVDTLGYTNTKGEQVTTTRKAAK
jgi:hypothetical protein